MAGALGAVGGFLGANMGTIAPMVGGILGSRGGGTKQRTLPTGQLAQSLTPNQYALLDRLANTLYHQIGKSGRVYQGPRVAPLSNLQQQGLYQAGQLPQETDRFSNFAFGNLQKASQGFDPQAIQQMMSPVGDYAMNLFTNRLAPAAMGMLGQRGAARSSGAAQKLGQIGSDLASGISAQFAPLQMQGANIARRSQLGAAGGAMNLANMNPNMIAQMMNFGQLPRGVAQQHLGAQQQKFGEAEPWRNPALGFMGPALNTGAYTPLGQENVFQERSSFGQNFFPQLGKMVGQGQFNNLFSGIFGGR